MSFSFPSPWAYGHSGGTVPGGGIIQPDGSLAWPIPGSNPSQQILIVVHPGSMGGSADFNLGAQAQEVRGRVLDEILKHKGPVVSVLGELQDEIGAYPELRDIQKRTDTSFESGPGEDELQAVAQEISSYFNSPDLSFIVTGAWADQADGCAYTVYETLKRLGRSATLSPNAACLGSNPLVARNPDVYSHPIPVEDVADAMRAVIEPDDRIVVTNSPAIKAKVQPQEDMGDFKPIGLWYAFGSAWINLLMDRGMRSWVSCNVFKLHIDYSNIAVLETPEDAMAFTETYGVMGQIKMLINWKKVSKDYFGIEIHERALRLGPQWMRPWDVPSGCIWDGDALIDVDRLYTCAQGAI